MFKTCSKCNQTKDLAHFYLKDKITGRRHAQCKSCNRIARTLKYKVHYEKYGEQYRDRARKRKLKIKSERQKLLYQLLSGKVCEHCGYDDIRALEFDHIDPTLKSFGISRAINDCYAWDKILIEIKKCRVLCANCHKIRTAQQQNWSKWRLGRVVRQDSAKVRTPVQIR